MEILRKYYIYFFNPVISIRLTFVPSLRVGESRHYFKIGDHMSNKHKAKMISASDITLFHQGTLYLCYRSFGAHFSIENGESGVRFTVWAPHARQVGLAADFNHWSGDNDVLYKIPDSGIWSRFFPGISEGIFYKYEIIGAEGKRSLKADPFAFYAEVRPATASITYNLEGYRWQDQAWRRKVRIPYEKPLHVYELHAGTWKQTKAGEMYSYKQLAIELIPYIKKMGYTHIELMPLTEHPYDGSWGYQTTGYFAPTSRYGAPKDLMYFVDQCHNHDLGVILDWVPSHFTKDEHGLRQFDGTALYEYSDPLKAEKPGWGTLSFDFSKPEVVSFLISNALYWLEYYHFDGLRVDAVTSMLRLDFEKKSGEFEPNEDGGLENKEAIAFLQKLNEAVRLHYPHAMMIAEESSAWEGVTAPVAHGGLGFHYKWNMGWMNDTLKYIETPFEDRALQHKLLTFPICYAYSANFILPFSHDEVVHGKKSLLNKMPGEYEQKFAGLRILLGYLMTFPGKKLIFMGAEFGQFIEWREDAELDWFLQEQYEMHHKMALYNQALNQFYLTERALWEMDHSFDGYQWINPHDDTQSVICYMRKGKKEKDKVLVVINFLPVERLNYRVGVPLKGQYELVFNSDDVNYGGKGNTIATQLKSELIAWHEQKHSIVMDIPALSITIWKRNGEKFQKVIRTTKGNNISKNGNKK